MPGDITITSLVVSLLSRMCQLPPRTQRLAVSTMSSTASMTTASDWVGGEGVVAYIMDCVTDLAVLCVPRLPLSLQVTLFMCGLTRSVPSSQGSTICGLMPSKLPLEISHFCGGFFPYEILCESS